MRSRSRIPGGGGIPTKEARSSYVYYMDVLKEELEKIKQNACLMGKGRRWSEGAPRAAISKARVNWCSSRRRTISETWCPSGGEKQVRDAGVAAVAVEWMKSEVVLGRRCRGRMRRKEAVEGVGWRAEESAVNTVRKTHLRCRRRRWRAGEAMRRPES
ncbi:hypothetical protein Dimus_019051 [Dionaea muscipula]